MRVEKEKHKVNIICLDRSVIVGVVHINPCTRLMDLLNRTGEDFIVVTNVTFQNIGEIHAFKLYNELSKKRNTICLNKNAIKWIEEL